MYPDSSDSAPEGTRLALIEAGIQLFGKHSFAATSTRQLAANANTNIASIAYHFGGKDGLRSACAQEFVRRVGAVVASVPEVTVVSAEMARQQLRAILRGMVAFLIGGHQADDMVPFMLRELAEGGPAVDIVYQRMIEPTHRRLCRLWGTATGVDHESQAVRLQVFSLVGQVMYFRIGATIVTRRMGWSEMGQAEAASITETLLGNLDAMLGAEGKA
jgi:TetR/AcrR family transcriptional regulator, regulator of cefoperazone and chloramphenicol sensitivity